jgi:hypothetical protein
MMPDTPDADAKGGRRALATAKPAPFHSSYFLVDRVVSLKSHVLFLAAPNGNNSMSG